MRNLFDQFKQQENRLTHALMCCLHEDPRMLRAFVRWATGTQAPPGKLQVAEQSLPGEEGEDDALSEQQRRGLPDGWVFDEEGWSLLIESKIECRLEADQIRRHRYTAGRRGFTTIHTLALVTEPPEATIDQELKIRRWSDLYLWLKTDAHESQWARRLITYMEVLEAKLIRDGYLKTGTLTVFSGIPFGEEVVYNYLDAKRILRLAMDELRQRKDLNAVFGIDHGAGRTAITGKGSSAVWDYLRLARSTEAKNFTEFPHLTLGLHREFIHAIVIVPNGLRTDFRKNLLGHGLDSFLATFAEIQTGFTKSLGGVRGAIPWVEVVQRRYPFQRSEPFIDALLEFDLRTAFPAIDPIHRAPKLQPQWLESVYEALVARNANLQLGVGVRFPYDRCDDAKTQKILDHIAHAWIACAPLVNRIVSS